MTDQKGFRTSNVNVVPVITAIFLAIRSLSNSCGCSDGISTSSSKRCLSAAVYTSGKSAVVSSAWCIDLNFCVITNSFRTNCHARWRMSVFLISRLWRTSVELWPCPEFTDDANRQTGRVVVLNIWWINGMWYETFGYYICAAHLAWPVNKIIRSVSRYLYVDLRVYFLKPLF